MRSFSLIAILGACAVACSSGPNDDIAREATASTHQRIIRGRASDDSQDAVVLLLRTENGQLASSCTGTLLAPNLVLTARHCVSDTDHGALCDEQGNAVSGAGVIADYAPSDIFVVTGPSVSWTQPEASGRGARIFHDGSKVLCNHDLALLSLTKPIAGAKIAPVRLDAPPAIDERFTAIGWGLTEGGQSPSQRMTRPGISVIALGPSADFGAGRSEFVVGEGICSGDSGGPALSSKGAVVGVVSRGGNGTSSDTNPAGSCVGTATRNTYTSLGGFKSLILKAYDAAGQKPWLEGEPDPRLAKFGDSCSDGTACASGLCYAASGTTSGTCTMSCAEEACPDGYECADLGEATACRPKTALTPQSTTPSNDIVEVPPQTHCAVAPGAGSSGGVATGLLALSALVLARRRRERP